jgi:hypothetical protein
MTNVGGHVAPKSQRRGRGKAKGRVEKDFLSLLDGPLPSFEIVGFRITKLRWRYTWKSLVAFQYRFP